VAAGSSTVDDPALSIPRPPRFWASPFGWGFAASVCVAVVSAVVLLVSGLRQPAEPVVTLKGVMASKVDFFDDPQVQRLLLERHIKVEVTNRGSREVALEVIGQETDYDFAFPSGQPAADLIKKHRAATSRYFTTTRLFSSPMVLASYREYAEALVGRGVATRQASGAGEPLYYTLDTAKFIELGERGETWNSIGIRGITNGNRVLARTPGVCRSNAGATYLGLVTFVKNGGRAPQSKAEAMALATQLRPLVLATGMPEEDLFETYVGLEGKSQGPVVVVYEHQFLEHQIRHEQRTGNPDTSRVLLYPTEEFQTDPEFISLKPGSGDRLASLLESDPALRGRMMELGYRVIDRTDSTGTARLFEFLEEQGIAPPATRTDLTRAELPQLDLLETLIDETGRCTP
jgi:hypothetical protein